MSIMQRLYDSEINCEISTFWDGGFTWKLGDGMNGYDAEGEADTFVKAEQQLADKARELYPQSKFARETRQGFPLGG